MPDQVAIIDMGTNTFHLLIAETGSKPEVTLRESVVVKIGKGGINDGRITAEGMDRALSALKKFKKILDDQKVSQTRAFATSAIRNASNGEELVRKIRESTGIETRIISGDEEAELIYYGVRSALNLGTEKSLIVDIGGGSVEFIIANGASIFWKSSIEIGAQRLLEQFQKHDPILPEEINKLMEYFALRLQHLKEQLIQHHPKVLAGSSGSFDTLSEIFCEQKGIAIHPDDKETPLTFESFQESYREITSKNRLERLAIPGMLEMRVDMIVVASCLVKYLLDIHRFEKIRVSTYSLKEGALVSSF